MIDIFDSFDIFIMFFLCHQATLWHQTILHVLVLKVYKKVFPKILMIRSSCLPDCWDRDCHHWISANQLTLTYILLEIITRARSLLVRLLGSSPATSYVQGDLSVVFTRLISKSLWSGWKLQWGVKEMHSPFIYSPVIREWSWKKTQIETKYSESQW